MDVLLTKEIVGVRTLMVVLLSILGLENPGNSDCCTGCFGSRGRKNLLSVAPIVATVAFFELTVEGLDVLSCIDTGVDVTILDVGL